MYASVNFLSRAALRRAVAGNQPVVLYSPTLTVPAINGTEIVEGPWPGTPAPVEDLVVQRKAHPRQRLKPWRAHVRVQDMRVVEVLS